jgi:hypothetical protein
MRTLFRRYGAFSWILAVGFLIGAVHPLGTSQAADAVTARKDYG